MPPEENNMVYFSCPEALVGAISMLPQGGGDFLGSTKTLKEKCGYVYTIPASTYG